MTISHNLAGEMVARQWQHLYCHCQDEVAKQWQRPYCHCQDEVAKQWQYLYSNP